MPAPATASPTVDLPAGLRPPFALALARPSDTIPAARSLPGGSQYEPKWDGFRLAIVRDGEHTSLWSRQGKDLTSAFPDLTAAAHEQVPPGFVLDGEAVIWTDGRLDFDRLQDRLVTRGPNRARAVRRTPAVFVGFDLLAAAGHDLRAQPLRTRRALLEALTADWTGPLQLSPATTAPTQARTWFAELPATGIEGLVVKGLSQPYGAGRRDWVKVKHRDTIDVICAAITGTLTHPADLVLGRYGDGELQVIGRTSALHPAAARRIAEQIRPAHARHPWAGLPGTGLRSRFGTARSDPPVTLVEPFVVEISADVALSGAAYRHPVRFVRTRPEYTPADLRPAARAS